MQTVTFSTIIRQVNKTEQMMNLQELEGLLIDAQRYLGRGADWRHETLSAIRAAKLMVQAEMARIGRIRAGEQQDGDERRAGGMNVGDTVRLTNMLPIRKPSGEIWQIVSSGAQGEIRRMLRADGKLVGVFFSELNVEVAVSTRDLELVK